MISRLDLGRCGCGGLEPPLLPVTTVESSSISSSIVASGIVSGQLGGIPVTGDGVGSVGWGGGGEVMSPWRVESG